MYSLEHLTVLSCTPSELVHVAADAGYDQVGLRTMPLGIPGEPECDLAANPPLLRETRKALAATGLTVSDVEVVRIESALDPRSYERGFAAAAELGATDVTTSVWTSDAAYARDAFDATCAVAKPYGLRLNIEFVAIAEVRTLAQAIELLRSVEATNIGLLLDTYHVHRARTDVAELDGLPSGWFHYYQLCDAPAAIPASANAIREEVREHRLFLGEGRIDVAGILAHLPDVTYALEIPNLARLEESGPLEYARRCLATAKAYFAHRPRAAGLGA